MGCKDPYLQTIVAEQTEERDDCVENRQEAQRWLHVTCALLKHKLIHVKERVLVTFILTPRVLILFLLHNLFSDLKNRIS